MHRRPDRSYSRLMSDARFHARNLERVLEEAQGKAPEQDLAWLDRAIAVAEGLRRGSLCRHFEAARRGGTRVG